VGPRAGLYAVTNGEDPVIVELNPDRLARRLVTKLTALPRLQFVMASVAVDTLYASRLSTYMLLSGLP
jgi:hypothetical protein